MTIDLERISTIDLDIKKKISQRLETIPCCSTVRTTFDFKYI